MKIKIIILYLFLTGVLFSYCSSGTRHISAPPPPDIAGDEAFKRQDSHQGITGNFLFYVSKENSQGDIWLYNLDTYSKWQITSVNNKNIEILSLSPSYKYIIYNYDNKNSIIYDLDKERKTDYNDTFFRKYNFSPFRDVNWINDSGFIFLSCTNRMVTNIFIASFDNNEKEWNFGQLYYPMEFLYLYNRSIRSLSLSPNKTLLAFIAKDMLNMRYIYIWDLKLKKIKKLVSVRGLPDLLWSENNKDIFYYENNILYSIDIKGAKNLIVSQANQFYKLAIYPKYRYKFFYISAFNNYYFVNLKNIDYIGEGGFLFNTQNMKDVMLYERSDLFFYDDDKNEIYYYNLRSLEIKKILGNAALYKLIP